ncbi:MAG TPA: HEAT repeat domain-containing protein [Myxococcota bacterium]|nr:HEAT repeat domain-containing protein [Myxococcota bacterium]
MNQPRASAATEGNLSERTPSEATALLVELGRAVKARSFYAAGEPEVRLLLARAWRSLHGNLLRHGRLDVTADGAGLCVPSLGLRVPSVQLGGLAQRLAERRVTALRFDGGLDADGLARLVDWLAADASDAPGVDAFRDALAAGGVLGVALNPSAERGVPRGRAAERAAAGVAADAAASARRAAAVAAPASAGSALDPPPLETSRSDAAHDAASEPAVLQADAAVGAASAPVSTGPAREPQPTAFEPPTVELEPGPVAPETDDSQAAEWLGPGTSDVPVRGSLGADLLAAESLAAERPARAPAVAPARAEDELVLAGLERGLASDSLADAETDPAPEPELEPELRFENDASPPFADSDATPASSATPRVGVEDTDTEAVEASSGAIGPDDGEDARPSELAALLRELAGCEDDFQYHDLARRAEGLAAALADEGHVELGYRALTLFAHHAGDDGKRSPLQRDAAADHLQRLASGARLAELIDRACSPEADTSLSATQVLMRLGGRVVPVLFRAAERESDPTRRGHLHGILIAMGDAALPEVLRAMESDEPGAVRAGIRLAGEMQSPRAVEPLASLLEGDAAPLRQEAAKALVRIGDGRAIDALVRALESPVEGVPGLASYCLGAAGTARAADALAAALRRSLLRRQFPFATELVRALGRLGRPEPVRELAALSRRGGLRNRRALRELRVAAVTALGRLPGDEAVAALAECARSRDAHVRRAAEHALERRASAAR